MYLSSHFKGLLQAAPIIIIIIVIIIIIIIIHLFALMVMGIGFRVYICSMHQSFLPRSL